MVCDPALLVEGQPGDDMHPHVERAGESEARPGHGKTGRDKVRLVLVQALLVEWNGRGRSRGD
jgi:hypothetical protein